jgi:hypothetical protein
VIHLTMTTEVSSIRAYDQPDGYDRRLPYLGIVTVTHLTDKIVYLHGAVGKIDRATRDKAIAMLIERGVTTLMFERRGRMKTIELAAPAVQLDDKPTRG